jgi:hypothetical protein
MQEPFPSTIELHGLTDVRQTKLLMAEKLVPEKSAFEFELAIEMLKGHKSPGIQIPTEFIKAGGSTFLCEIHKPIIFYLE